MLIPYTLLLLCCLCCSYSYKLLVVFSSPRKSVSSLGDGIVRHLLKARHEVTFMTAAPSKIMAPKLRIIDISLNSTEGFEIKHKLMLSHFMNNTNYLTNWKDIQKMGFKYANYVLFHENMQKLIKDPKEHFDIIIILWSVSDLYCGLASVFNCPYVWVTTMEPMNIFLSLLDGISNPAYTTNVFSPRDPPFTFWQRVKELYTLVQVYYTRWYKSEEENECFKKAFSQAVAKRGRTLPAYDEVKYNASLALGNSHVSSGQAMRFPQAFKQIGGFHIDDEVKPLPEDLQKLMDEAQDGVVYFSMGSILRSMDMTDDMKSGILRIFSELKQTVIWKFEGSLNNLPKNVHIFKWTPQHSILAHKNCRLFITHGGQLSITEAIHFGVPVIGIPIYVDQFINVNRAVDKGFGERVDFEPEMFEKFKKVIEDVLGNPQYKKKALEYSAIYHHRLAPPGTELVFWIEHVIRTNGADHLRSPILRVPIYQKLYLDLIAVILAILYFIFKLFMYVLRSAKHRRLKKKHD